MAKKNGTVMLTLDMTKEEILGHLAAKRTTVEAASEMLAEMERVAATKAKKNGELYCKVSEKKAVSLYGLRRMPITLYAGEWEQVFGFQQNIEAFIANHNSELARKDNE